ncbi:MAG: GTPase ObgE [Candidatus Aminicenantes bacterium]|nr:GTPase ObgE [Candidatus Aminicenantes bacterium]
MFADRVQVILRAGRGGNGCLSFRREWGVPKGGPDGGRGGDGGSVYLISDRGVKSLSYFRFHPINKARSGSHGEGNNRQGKRGSDLTLLVPPGTVVKDADRDGLLFDFDKPGLTYLAAKGGRGGRGNASFASATHRAPRECEPGKPGEDKKLILELKLIADVGLVGFPNVGKSTLISRVSSAKPVIADYPFTTLIPNLGVVDLDEERSFVVADIPGLIGGAHLGHGLGVRFLRHVERTRVLVHVVDLSPHSGRDPVDDLRVVRAELEAFQPGLLGRKQVVAANKSDLLAGDSGRLSRLRRFAAGLGMPCLAISALKKTGLKALLSEIWKALESAGSPGAGEGAEE